jgi:hypothetical protein
MDLQETRWHVVDWIHFSQVMDRCQDKNAVVRLRLPQKAGNCLSSGATICFSKILLHTTSFWFPTFDVLRITL